MYLKSAFMQLYMWRKCKKNMIIHSNCTYDLYRSVITCNVANDWTNDDSVVVDLN